MTQLLALAASNVNRPVRKNKLPYDDTIAAEQRQSDHIYTVVLIKGDKFMRRLCMNCEESG